MAIKKDNKADAAYKKKIADLHKDVEAAAKKLQVETERYEFAKKEAKAVEAELAKAKREREELSSELSSLSAAIVAKRSEGEAAVTATHEDVSRVKLEKETLEFTLEQLRVKVSDAHLKASEIHDIQARHTEARARLDAADTAAHEAEARRDSAQAEADKIVGDARAREEEILVRERKVEAAVTELQAKHAQSEFYRNRIVAYCVEKGLPTPNFSDGAA